MPSRRKQKTTKRSDKAHAMHLIRRAYEAKTAKKQMELAQQALECCPDLVDANLMVAYFAPSSESALPLLENAVASAAREIGKEAFDELRGEFWGFVETRPYMEAKYQLAECLLELGRSEEGQQHFREMLELNPNDNQGCRHRLASELLKSDQLEELDTLLERYPDDAFADWHYIRALMAFKRFGDCEDSRDLLQRAALVNEYVPLYLAGTKRLPRELPEFISPGEETEAVCHVAEFLPMWRGTPGALPWLRKTLSLLVPASPRQPRFNWKAAKDVLLQLPLQETTAWEIELLQFRERFGDVAGDWALIVADSDGCVPLLMRMWDERPRDSEVWRLVVEAMHNPQHGEPHRPREIFLTRRTFLRNWQKKLDEIGVACTLVEGVPQIGATLEEFERSLKVQSQPDVSLLEAPGNLEELPQEAGEIWYATVRKLPAWVQIGDVPCRLTVRLVLDATDDLILRSDIAEDDPADDWLWQGLVAAMYQPLVGDPHRPGIVQFATEDDLAALRPYMADTGIGCAVGGDQQKINDIVDDLTDHIAGPRRVQPLVRTPGVTPLQLESFFAAAADFYRDAPWRRIPGDTVIQIETEAFSSGPWYAVVMGQMGMELGLALYEDLEFLREVLSGKCTDKENGRRTSALSVTYGEMYEIAAEDYDAIEQFGWPIAGEEAYPLVMRINPGLAFRAPLLWEIDLLEGCLQAIPLLLGKGANRGRSEQTVKTPTREMTLRLSIVE